MKHLFYIHSYITYYVGLGVIKYHNLDHADCVLMYGRKFKPLHSLADIQQVDLPFTHHPVNSFAVDRMFWRGWGKLNKFDSFVKKLAKEDKFHLYTNQTGMDFIRLFISHKQCKGYSFLEEGVASYFKLAQVNSEIHPSGSSTVFFRILLKLNFRGRLSPEKWFYNSVYDFVYGLSEDSFPGFERKVILTLPFYNSNLMPDYGHILVLDADPEYGFTSISSVLKALEEGLLYLIGTSVKKLWVKYHPEQASSCKAKQPYEQVFEKYSGKLKIEEVPQHVSLEFVAGNANNSKTVFYVFLSSSGLYAGLCGREVYSFASYMYRFDPQYEQRVQRLPDAFKENVKFL